MDEITTYFSEIKSFIDSPKYAEYKKYPLPCHDLFLVKVPTSVMLQFAHLMKEANIDAQHYGPVY